MKPDHIPREPRAQADAPGTILRGAALGAKGRLDDHIANVLHLVAKANRKHYWQMTPVEARTAYERAARVLEIAPAPVHHCETLAIPRIDGGTVPARLYLPREASWAHPLAVLVFFHGGGFTVGSAATADAIARLFCTQAECAVVNVDYRLAPEHRFPAAFDDAMAALRWAIAQGHEWGFDPQRVAVGGDSAGGTLAAACAIAARDERLPLALQLLVYPGTAAHQDTGSHFEFADGFLLTRQTILWFFSQYIEPGVNRADWRFAPLCAPSLRDLAPAWIAVAEFDPLVDEGIAYADALTAAGNAVELQFCAGMIHGFFSMGGYVPAVRDVHAAAVAALRRALHAHT